jgi:hypothetical protein
LPLTVAFWAKLVSGRSNSERKKEREALGRYGMYPGYDKEIKRGKGCNAKKK